jgi:hypothetical protein
MAEDYCFKCGSWTRIDPSSKLCGRCYDDWPAKDKPAPDKAGQSKDKPGR